MMHRRAALISGLSMAAFPGLPRNAAAEVSPQDRADLGRIETYLNGIRSMRSRFVQTAPDGDVTQGVALMQRPGKMRFAYDPPTPFLLVANYGTLFFHDASLKQTSNIPLGRTPLGILLADQTILSGDVTVRKFVRLPGQFQVTMVRTATPGEGSLTLVLADNPMVLRQWIVVDQQGKQTRVTLTNLESGVRLDTKQFEFSNPVSAPGGGG